MEEIKNNLEKDVYSLLMQYMEQKLIDITPVLSDRLLTLSGDCADSAELRILKTAIQYSLVMDARSLNFLEKTALNWLQKGVPRWVLPKIEAGGFQVDKHLAKEMGWHGKDEGPLDFTQDEYYGFYRRT